MERAVLIGLTSRGPTPCGQLQSYGINTRIKMFVGWIKEKTGENFRAKQLDSLTDGAWLLNDNMLMYFLIVFTILFNFLD